MNERLDGLPSSEPSLSDIQACDEASQRTYLSQVHQCNASIAEYVIYANRILSRIIIFLKNVVAVHNRLKNDFFILVRSL